MKSTFLGALLLAPFLLFSQQQFNRCASFDIIRQWEQQYPGTEAALNQVIINAQNYSQGHDKRDGSRANDTIYRIPVVVHIVYTNAAENLHDSVINNQIQVLNNAFRRTNADTMFTRNEFKPLAGDAGIEFFLADLDPSGNPTTGITRTAGTPPASFGFSPFNDAMKKTADGGIDAWPTDRYLNIWVCNMSGNPLGLVLGYAYPPMGNHPNWPAGSAPADSTLQGVVIHTPVFGANNSLIATDPMLVSMNRGKSLVHEVGHFLGLRHIWGESSNPFAPGACNIDDYIKDTPPTIDRSQQECDLTKNQCGPVCPNLPDYHDMIENYMDYSVDSCNNMFTYGQIQVMRGVLGMYRTRLAQVSLGTIKPHDYTTANPVSFVATGGDSVVVVIDFTRWYSNSVYPNLVAIGDTLFSSIEGEFRGDTCQLVVLHAGDYLVTPNGDTITFNIGDTVTTYSDGTLQVDPYIASVGLGNIHAANFSLYPNPTTGMVNVRLNGEAKSLTVFNLLGQTMLKQSLSSNTNVLLDVSHLTPGVYLVQVQGAMGTATQRLVIE